MSGFVWLDGALRHASEARIDAADRGFLLGDGIFETMRVLNGAVPLLDRHLARLAEGARVLRLPPPDKAMLREAIAALIAANGVASAALRLTYTRGAGARGLLPPPDPLPTILIAAFPAPEPLPPARVIISRFSRDGASVLSRIKTLNYLPNILARLEARDEGAGDALLVNPHGRIASGTSATLVAQVNGALVTPSLSEGALAGISRALLLESGFVAEGRISPEEIDAAWLVNALSLREVTSIDGRDLAPDKEKTDQISAIVHL